LLILLITGLIFANSVLPKALITIKTDATNIDLNLNLNLDKAAKNFDPETGTLPSEVAKIEKTYTKEVPTTGQKNNGDKATGSVTMTAKKCTGNPFVAPSDVPAGTGITHDGLTYITQSTASFSGTGTSGGCYTYSAGSISIVAQSGGKNYNTGSGSSFSVPDRSDVSASGSATGGTDNIVQIVNQNDITTAKSKIKTEEDTVKQDLEDSLAEDDFYAIKATYSASDAKVTSSPAVGAVGDNVTVTETVTYTMFGVHKDDLETLIKNAVKSQIDTSKQSILDDGLSSATFNVDSQTADKAELTMSTKAEVGPDLDIGAIKRDAAGKKPGAVKDALSTNPDVTSVDVKLSPFWVSSVPKNTSKIKVEIAKPQTTAGKSDN
jgi:hypothetical protein